MMKKSLLILFVGLCLVLVSSAPAAAQWFHRIGHVSKSRTKKSEHADGRVKHASAHKTKKRKSTKDEGYRHRELKRQAKLRGENAGRMPEATEPEPVNTAPEPTAPGPGKNHPLSKSSVCAAAESAGSGWWQFRHLPCATSQLSSRQHVAS